MSQDYDGPRDSQGIISYMKKNAGPSSVTLRDADHLTQKLDSASDVLVVGKMNYLFFHLFQFHGRKCPRMAGCNIMIYSPLICTFK